MKIIPAPAGIIIHYVSLDHIRNIIIRFGRRIGHVGGNLHIGRSHHEDIPRCLFDIATQGIYRTADKIENPLRHGNIDFIQIDDNRLAGFQIVDDTLRELSKIINYPTRGYCKSVI